MDFFRDYFTKEELMASVAKAPFIPGVMATHFQTMGLTSTTLALEETPANAPTLLTETPRGTPGRIEVLEKRKVHTFQTKHYRVDGAVYADEVLNMRGNGNLATEVIVQRRDEVMARMRKDIDLLHESLRITTMITPTNAFGTLPASVAILLATDGTKTRQEIFNKIITPMESSLAGLPFSGLKAYCSDGFWSTLIENKAIKDTVMNYAMAQSLRNDPRESVYFGGVMWERYRGVGTVKITDNQAIVIPEGVSGMFIQAFAPADTLDQVGAGAMGTPYYPQMLPSSDNRAWRLEMQTNIVTVCTRPTSVLTITLT